MLERSVGNEQRIELIVDEGSNQSKLSAAGGGVIVPSDSVMVWPDVKAGLLEGEQEGQVLQPREDDLYGQLERDQVTLQEEVPGTAAADRQHVKKIFVEPDVFFRSGWQPTDLSGINFY